MLSSVSTQRRVEVEAHLQGSLPAFTIVGLADRACQEAKERVRSGVRSAECKWPQRRITVNLAPAALRKEGSGFDLPIALAMLAASGQIPRDRLEGHAADGELALDGRVRPVAGVFAVAEGAKRAACRGSSAPPRRRPKPPSPGSSRCPSGTWPRRSPTSAASSCPSPSRPGTASFPPSALTSPTSAARSGRAARSRSPRPDGHNLLFGGPPGTGKTMLARRLPGLLPQLDESASLEVTRIHSVAGMLRVEHPLVTTPPFRAPHHTASAAAIVGGGRGRAR